MKYGRLAWFCALLMLGGCGDGSTTDAGTPADAAAGMDAGVSPDAGGSTDAATPDAGGSIDAGGPTDAGATDAATTAAGTMTDAGTDAGGPTDAGTDAGGCDYLDFDIWITDCGSAHPYVRRWTDIGGASGCPDYFTIGGTRYATLADALASMSCDSDCLRRAAMSVTLLRCGVRTGYITFEDPEMDCDDLLETPDGLFRSREEWDAAHPCP